MKTRTRTTFGLLSATALLASTGVALLAGPASADPPGGGTRPIVGVGSDTTDQVMNGMGEAITIDGVKPLASFDALGGAFRSRADNAACDYASNLPNGNNGAGIRANGSGAGRDRLVETLQASNPRAGCLDFARSSSGPGGVVTNPSVTYIPFAVDALPYAVRGDSTIPKDLSLETIKAIYACDPSTTASYLPLIPQPGSGTRQSWLDFVGIGRGAIPSCVKDDYIDPADGATKFVQEHSGRGFIDKRNIGPFASSQWAAQSVGAIADRRFGVVLGGVNGIPAIAANLGAVGTRGSFNIIPTSRVGSSANAQDVLLNRIFVGSGSEICKQTAVIGRFGLAPSTTCGNTSAATPTS